MVSSVILGEHSKWLEVLRMTSVTSTTACEMPAFFFFAAYRVISGFVTINKILQEYGLETVNKSEITFFSILNISQSAAEGC